MQLFSQMPISSTHPDHSELVEAAFKAELFDQFVERAIEHHFSGGEPSSTIDEVWDDCHYLMKHVELSAMNIIEFLLERGVDAACGHEELQDFLDECYYWFNGDVCNLLVSLADAINCELYEQGFPIESDESDDDCEDCDDDC